MNRILSLAALLLAVSSMGLQAQTVPAAMFSPDARSAAMADAGSALYGKGMSIYVNSAAAALSEDDFAAAFTYSRWQPDIAGRNDFAIGAFYKFADRFTVALGARGLFYGETVLVGGDGMHGETLSPKDLSVDLSFGMKIIDGFSAAVNAHYYRMDNLSAGNGFAADIEMMYAHRYFTAALSAKNLGPALSYADGAKVSMPAEVRAGVSSSFDFAGDAVCLAPAVDVSYFVPVSAVSAAAGVELKLFKILSLRGGYRFSSDTAALPSYASVGAGVEFFGVNVDAAYYIGTGVSPVGNSFRICLGFVL